MAKRADLFLHPKPGTDLVWLSAVTRYILENGLAKTSFLEKWVNGLEEYKKSLKPFTMEFAAETCGLPIETLTNVARMIAEANSIDRKSTRLNSSHQIISYAVFCLKKKKSDPTSASSSTYKR